MTSKGIVNNVLGEVRDQLEVIDDLGAGVGIALCAKGQDTTESTLQVLLRGLMAGVVLQAGIRHPVDVRVLLEPASKGNRIASVSLGSQAESLDANEELLSSEGVEGASEVTKDVDADADGECHGTKGLPKLQAVITVRWLDHLRETFGILAPVELAAVDDDTSDGCAVAANPLGSAVDNDVRTVVYGPAEVAASTERVVNLGQLVREPMSG